MKEIEVKDGQNLFDIALQEYGSLEAIYQLLKDNSGINLSTELYEGLVLKIDETAIVDQNNIDFFELREIKPNNEQWTPTIITGISCGAASVPVAIAGITWTTSIDITNISSAAYSASQTFKLLGVGTVTISKIIGAGETETFSATFTIPISLANTTTTLVRSGVCESSAEIVIQEAVLFTTTNTDIDFEIGKGFGSLISIAWGDGDIDEDINGTNASANPTHTYTDGLSSHVFAMYGDISGMRNLKISNQGLTQIEKSELLFLNDMRIDSNSLSELGAFGSLGVAGIFDIRNNDFSGTLNMAEKNITFDEGKFKASGSGFSVIEGFSSGDTATGVEIEKEGNITSLDLTNLTFTGTSADSLSLFRCRNLTEIKGINGNLSERYRIESNDSLEEIEFVEVTGTGVTYEVTRNDILSSVTISNSYDGNCKWNRNNFGVISDISKINPSSNFLINRNNMTAAEVNENLVLMANNTDFDSITIEIDGNNAAADSTSGGFDGLAAIDTLRARGCTVTESGGY